MTRSSPLALAAACALLACAAEVPGVAPDPTSVTPSSAHQPDETLIVVEGEGFQVQPYQDADGRPRVDDRFRAWLGATELAEVAWVSPSELRARVPAGLPLGTHRLTVLAPSGRSGTLPAAFTVHPGTAAALTAGASVVPGVTNVGRTVLLEVSVTNGGATAAQDVSLAVSAVGNAVALPPQLPPPVVIPAGTTHRFQVVCTAVALGTTVFEVDVAGADAVTGEPVSAPHVTSGPVIVQADEAAAVVEDPFGDGTAFAYVFGYHGDVFLGPSKDGRGLARCRPDGTGCTSLSLSFERDVTGSALEPELHTTVSENTVCPALATLGATPYCDPVSPQTTACACGPDYEVGRGLWGAVSLGSPPQEWLVAMGRVMKAGDLSYLYMTRDVAAPLGFSYVDLYAALPASASGTGAVSMAVLNDRLYVGLQVVKDAGAGARGPRLVVLTRTPTAPGLDSGDADAFATTFQGTPMGELEFEASQVDAMLGFEGRLFVANRRAVLVSRTGFPTGAPDASTQFDDCTPPAEGGWEATSIVKYTGKVDVTPADRGVTALAAWKGRLYLGRNTRPVPPGTLPPVPELWAFTPRHDPASGELLACASSDWELVARNFGSDSSTALTALFASPSYLYVGYDDAVLGARLFRTADVAPVGESAFQGRLGCTAGCEPVGGAGLGDPSNTRFLDARAVDLGGVDHVWVTLGDGSGAVRAYRISE